MGTDIEASTHLLPGVLVGHQWCREDVGALGECSGVQRADENTELPGDMWDESRDGGTGLEKEQASWWSCKYSKALLARRNLMNPIGLREEQGLSGSFRNRLSVSLGTLSWRHEEVWYGTGKGPRYAPLVSGERNSLAGKCTPPPMLPSFLSAPTRYHNCHALGGWLRNT